VVTTNSITISTVLGEALATEAAGPSIGMNSKHLRNGVLRKSILVEKRILDLTPQQFAKYIGLRTIQVALPIEAQTLINGTWSFMGEQEAPLVTATVSSGDTPASTDETMSASINVGEIIEGGVALTTALQAVNFTINGNGRARTAVASQFPIEIALGTFEVTGTINAYFEDAVLYNKFKQFTATSLSMRVTDNASQTIVFTIPRLFFPQGSIPLPGVDQDIIVPLEFVGIRDPVTNSAMQIDFIT